MAALGAALAVTVCPASAAAATPASFSSAAVYGTGQNSTAVAVLDVKGDGRQDIAVANSQSSDITLLLNDGAGGFSHLGDLVAGVNHPAALTVGDFNEDGFQDLAVANQGSSGTNGVVVEFGSPTGFSGTTTASTHLNPAAIAAGDFNGDGHQDLAVGNGNSNDVSVLLGTGSGTFSSPTNFAVHASPSSIAVGDFNRDGHEDLAVSNTGDFSTASTDDVSVLLGTGTGSFGAHNDFGAGQHPSAVAVGDFNEDGKQDLAVSNANGGDASVLLGAGDGTFGPASSFPAGSLVFGLVVGDFNGDGHQDLATANFNFTGLSVLLGSGTGTFSGAATFSTNAFGASALAVGDFNNDGRDDLTVAGHNQSNGTASVLLNTSHFPALSQLGSQPSSIGLPADVAVSPEKSGSVSNVYVGSPSGLLAFSRDTATGALMPIAAPSSPRGLTGAVDGNVTVSPDGKSVYLATGHALLVFARDTSTGALTQLAGTAGCINADGSDGCFTNRSHGTFVPDLVRFGPEAAGSTAYVVGPPNNVGTVLSIFSRDTSTGALTQASTAAGCISSTGLDGNGGSCQKVDELGNEADIAFTADGKHAYVASSSEATIVAFSRDTASGALTPLSGSARCVVNADAAANWPICRPGRALGGIEREALVGDNLYVTNTDGTNHGVAELAISPATGGLTQLTGANGCVSTTGEDGESTHGACARARVTNGSGDLGGPRAIVASPDGLDVYVVGENNGDLVTLARDLSSGALHDTACIGDNSSDAGCTQGSGMTNLSGLAISPDGRNLYGGGNSVSELTRRAPGFTVSGSASPAAGGTVAGSTSSPNSSCAGSSCTIDSGGSATLTAAAASGYRFTGWSGACSGTANPCTISNVTSDQSATANFVARVTVTGTPDPAAGGSVTASDSSSSASCSGASCTVDSGDTVTLTATPASGYRLSAWHGPCGGASSGDTCTVVDATSDTGATASFVRRVTVTGTASPTTGGFVHASSPSPNATCDNPVAGVCTLDAGDQVTLTATASNGHKFKGWSGACSGSNQTCTIAHVTGDLKATASFADESAAGSSSTGGSSTVVVPPKGTFKTGITLKCGGKPCQIAAGAKATVPGKKKASASAAAATTNLTVATFKRKLGAGKSLKLVMRMNHKGLVLLKKLHHMVVRVDVRMSAANARTVTTHRILQLKLAKHH